MGAAPVDETSREFQRGRDVMGNLTKLVVFNKRLVPLAGEIPYILSRLALSFGRNRWGHHERRDCRAR